MSYAFVWLSASSAGKLFCDLGYPTSWFIPINQIKYFCSLRDSLYCFERETIQAGCFREGNTHMAFSILL